MFSELTLNSTFVVTKFLRRAATSLRLIRKRMARKRVRLSDLAEVISGCVKSDGTGFDEQTNSSWANQVEEITATVNFTVWLERFTKSTTFLDEKSVRFNF